MQAMPTNDQEFRVSFLKIMLKKLTDCEKGASPNELHFAPQEHQVIEYYIKDVSREPVPEDTSFTELSEILIAKIILLCQGDVDEWDELLQIWKDFEKDISHGEGQAFNSSLFHFTEWQ